jgi:PadR family transcriptional regulator, regulatory protein AphA
MPNAEAKPKEGAKPLSPEYALLGFLMQQPAHGYELHQQLQTELGQVWRVSQSQTYNILKRLELQGFIAGQVKRQLKLPNQREFHLTPLGQARFAEWLHAPGRSSVRGIRLEFLTRLYFVRALEGKRAALKLIEGQQVTASAKLDTLKEQWSADAVQGAYNQLSVALQLRQLESVLKWLAQCQEQFAS